MLVVGTGVKINKSRMDDEEPFKVSVIGSPPLNAEYEKLICRELPRRPFSADHTREMDRQGSVSLLSVVTTETTVTLEERKDDFLEGSKSTPSSPSEALKMSRPKSERISKQKVILGTPIDEDHVSYVLMYDMLTGIRVAVQLLLNRRFLAVRPNLKGPWRLKILLLLISWLLICKHPKS